MQKKCGQQSELEKSLEDRSFVIVLPHSEIPSEDYSKNLIVGMIVENSCLFFGFFDGFLDLIKKTH